MTGHDYERAVCRYLTQHGYYGASVTKASGDYGVDVVAHKGYHKYAVQCKYYSKPVGIKAVQEVYAGQQYYGCDRAMVVTNATFTPAAVELARKTGVELVDGLVPSGRSFKSKLLRIIKIVGVVCGSIVAALIVSDCIKEPRLIPAYIRMIAILASPFILFLLIKQLIRQHRQNKKMEQIDEKPYPAPVHPEPITPATPTQEKQEDDSQNVELRIQLLREVLIRSECIDGLDFESTIYFLAYSPLIYTSLLQRHLRIGYARAGRIIGDLQSNGLISSTTPHKWLV